MKTRLSLAMSAALLTALSWGTARADNVLVLNIEDSTTWVRNFNPFAVGTARESTIDFIYEPLAVFNKYEDGKVYYRLAKNIALADDLKSVTVDLRDGAKWSDGKPITADDMVFTYDVMKKFPALDTTAIWSLLDSVTKTGPLQVKLTLKAPSSLAPAKINNVLIVPQHVWKDIADPVTFANENPVGSGPMTEIKRFTPQTYDQCRNPNYFEADKLQVDCLRFPQLGTNDQMLASAAAGDIDWLAAFIPDIDKSYVAKDPANFHYWFPPGSMVGFIFNMESANASNKKAFADLKFRQAASLAMDRTAMVNVAGYGYPTPNTDASGLGASFPTWTDKAVAEKHVDVMNYDVDKAKALLKDAGYADKDGDGLVENPDGSKLSFDVIVPNGWTDWVSTVQIAIDGMRSAGIDAKLATPESAVWQKQLIDGTYDAAISSWKVGATPFYQYNDSFNSAQKGKTRFTAQRFFDPKIDALLDEYQKTADPKKQAEAIHGIQAIVADNLPIIPVYNNPLWYEYSTKRFTGWASKENPWIDPTSYSDHYRVLQLLSLKPVTTN